MTRGSDVTNVVVGGGAANMEEERESKIESERVRVRHRQRQRQRQSCGLKKNVILFLF